MSLIKVDSVHKFQASSMQFPPQDAAIDSRLQCSANQNPIGQNASTSQDSFILVGQDETRPPANLLNSIGLKSRDVVIMS